MFKLTTDETKANNPDYAVDAPWIDGEQYQLGMWNGVPAVKIAREGSEVVTVYLAGQKGFKKACKEARRRGHP